MGSQHRQSQCRHETPPRVAWHGFPDAVLLAAESRTKQHSDYAGAKSGDAVAAVRLVHALVDEPGVAAVRTLIGSAGTSGPPVLVSAHAYEGEGVNAIPIALARLLASRLGLVCEEEVVQVNVVAHTGADGYGRLARQAAFAGEVDSAREYVLVDDLLAKVALWRICAGGSRPGEQGSWGPSA